MYKYHDRHMPVDPDGAKEFWKERGFNIEAVMGPDKWSAVVKRMKKMVRRRERPILSFFGL